jgi:cell division protein FtsN
MKIYSVVFIFVLFSCVDPDQQPRIRIVDLQGNPKTVNMRTPELNYQANIGSADADKQKIIPMQDAKEISAQTAFQPNEQALAQTIHNQEQEYKYLQEAPKTSSKQVLLTAGSSADGTTEYDLSESQKTFKKAEDEPQKLSNVGAKPSNAKPDKKNKVGIFVQVGSFSVLRNATNLLDEMKKFGTAKIDDYEVGGKTFHRVLIGPFKTKQKAAIAAKLLENAGKKTIIVKLK